MLRCANYFSASDLAICIIRAAPERAITHGRFLCSALLVLTLLCCVSRLLCARVCVFAGERAIVVIDLSSARERAHQTAHESMDCDCVKCRSAFRASEHVSDKFGWRQHASLIASCAAGAIHLNNRLLVLWARLKKKAVGFSLNVKYHYCFPVDIRIWMT